MPRIPRTEETVAFRSAEMPFSTGDGYEKPGKALQHLGKGIADLGQGVGSFALGLSAEQDKEDDFNTRLRSLQFYNNVDREDDNYRNTYAGDGEGYAAERDQWYQGKAQEFLGTLSPKGQKTGALFVEQKRSTFSNTSRNFEHHTRTQYRLNATDGIIADQFLDLQKAPEEELEDRIVGTLQGAEAIINRIPGVSEQQREALRTRAQQSVFSLLKGRMSDDKAADVLGRIAERAQEFQRQAPPGPEAPGAGPRPAGPAPGARLDPAKAPQGGRPIDVARSFLGASETKDTQALAAFFRQAGGQKLSPADTAWCAAFVNAALGSTGQKGTGTLLARDFLKFGTATDKPAEGDIVVLSRGNPNGWQGHVGFYAGKDGNGNVRVLGGNQGNRVSIQSFPAAQVLGFRKPPDAGTKLPGIDVAAAPVPAAAPATGKPVQVADAAGRIPGAPVIDSPARIGGASGNVGGRIPGNDNPTRVAGSEVYQAPARSSVWSNFIEGYNKAQPALQSARIRAIEEQLKAFEGGAAKGVALPDADMARLRQTVMGSGIPELQTRLAAGEAGLADTVRERLNPPEFIKQRRDALAASLTGPDGVMKATPSQIAALDYLDRLAKSTESALDTDPIDHAEKIGLLPAVPPLDPRMDAAQFKDVLDARVAAAQYVAGHYNREPVYFKKAEIGQLTEMMRRGGPEMLDRLSVIADRLGPEAPRAFAQFAADGKDAASIASLGYLISTGGDPAVIKDAAQALQLKSQQNANFKPQAPEADKARSAAVAVLGPSFRAMPNAMQNAIDLTNLAYEGAAFRLALDPKKSAAGFDAEVWKGLFKKVIGESVDPVTGNTYGGLESGGLFGQKTLLPPTIKQGGLSEIVASIRQEDIAPRISPDVDLKSGMPKIPDGKGIVGQVMDAVGLGPKPDPMAPGKVAPNAPEAMIPKQTGDEAESVRQAAKLADKAGVPPRLALMPGHPYDNTGKPLSVARLKGSVLVAVGPGRYWVDTSGGAAQPAWAWDPGAPDGKYVLDLNALEPKLRARRPDLWRPEKPQ